VEVAHKGLRTWTTYTKIDIWYSQRRRYSTF